MVDLFAPQAAPTERLLAEAYGFDPLAEAWPDPGLYVDPERGIHMQSPPAGRPSKARSVATQIFDTKVLAKLEDEAQEELHRFVKRAYRGPRGVFNLDAATITPRYQPKIVDDRDPNELTLSYQVVFTLSDATKKAIDGTSEEAFDVQQRVRDAIQGLVNVGLRLGKDNSVEWSTHMLTVPPRGRRQTALHMMMWLDLPKINFEGLDWNKVKGRLVKVRETP